MHRYAAYMRNQVTELLTKYGKIDILWFDFSYPNSKPEPGKEWMKGKGKDDWEAEKLIALARVPLSDARVLIFDEATSNVDSYTEPRIQQAFAGLRAGRTCVVIAHRLSTIRGADRIVVMHEGQVAECGTHEELLARNGRYRAMIEEMEEAEGEK